MKQNPCCERSREGGGLAEQRSMVNLESQNLMQLSDFSVLHEIFHPAGPGGGAGGGAGGGSVDPKLVLSTGPVPHLLSALSPDSAAADRKLSPRPAPAPVSPGSVVPLSVHELETKEFQAQVKAQRSEAGVETSVSVTVQPAPAHSPPGGGKASPVDIVHLAAEEIRKPLLKFKDESKVFKEDLPSLNPHCVVSH